MVHGWGEPHEMEQRQDMEDTEFRKSPLEVLGQNEYMKPGARVQGCSSQAKERSEKEFSVPYRIMKTSWRLLESHTFQPRSSFQGRDQRPVNVLHYISILEEHTNLEKFDIMQDGLGWKSKTAKADSLQIH
ncbi:hypothetical protein MMC28_009591 [Mycoblastus sanguinarius]|nr:hypothetical protein [Mycoblastus sanguinarius]